MMIFGEDGDWVVVSLLDISPAKVASCPRCRLLVQVEVVPPSCGGTVLLDPPHRFRAELRALLPLGLAVRQTFARGSDRGHRCERPWAARRRFRPRRRRGGGR